MPAIELPRPGSLIRTLVDFVMQEKVRTGSEIVSLWPLIQLHGVDAVTRQIRVLRRDPYFWYISKAIALGSEYTFGNWAEYSFSRGVRIPLPDPRWRASPSASVYRAGERQTLFRPEPQVGTTLHRIYNFLLDNRTPGTHVVNVQTLYERYGTKKVAKSFHELKKHYGFSIVPAGQLRNFVVTRKPNLKKPFYSSPIDSPDYKDDGPKRP